MIAGALTGLFWGKLIAVAHSTRDIEVAVVMAFLAALPIDGMFSALNPLYTFVLVGWKTAVPMFAIIAFINWFERLNRRWSTRVTPARHTSRYRHLATTRPAVR